MNKFLLASSFILLLPLITGCVKKTQTVYVELDAPSTKLNKPLNSIASTTQKLGVKNCLNSINDVSNFLTEVAEDSGVAIFVAPQHPDEKLSSISFEAKSDNEFSYSTATFSPSRAKGCSAVYETVMYWKESCKKMKGKVFKSSHFNDKGSLSNNIQVLEGKETQVRIYLMPAGKNGCVTIKKEIVF